MRVILFCIIVVFSSGSSILKPQSSCGAVCQLIESLYILEAQCNANSYIQEANFAYYLNNQWGSGAASQGYYQCLDGTTVSYSWWSADGQDDNVKAYPAIITGWHWGYMNGQGNAGLPVLLSSNPKIITNWSVQHVNTGNYETYNTAFDIWLGGVGETNPGQPNTEVMIWMNHVRQYPLGNYVETINMWGSQYDVYAHFGGNPNWNVFTFINKQNTWNWSNQDIFQFFNYLWNSKKWISGGQYICGIEAGNEIIQGAGSFTHTYSLKVN